MHLNLSFHYSILSAGFSGAFHHFSTCINPHFHSAMASVTKTWVSTHTLQPILKFTHFATPVILLLAFLVAFTAHSIVTATKDDVIKPESNQTGPGGKPLPRTTSPAAKAKQKDETLDLSPRRKLLFTLLSIFLLLTFVGHATLVIVHALTHRKDNWWCGQSVVVCKWIPAAPASFTNAISRFMLWLASLSTLWLLSRSLTPNRLQQPFT